VRGGFRHAAAGAGAGVQALTISRGRPSPLRGMSSPIGACSGPSWRPAAGPESEGPLHRPASRNQARIQPPSAVARGDTTAACSRPHLIRRQMAPVRCIQHTGGRPVRCAVQRGPCTSVGGHRDLPAGVHQVRARAITESEPPPGGKPREAAPIADFGAVESWVGSADYCTQITWFCAGSVGPSWLRLVRS
jgi:hypothetical protein